MNIIKLFNNTIDYLETVLDDEIDEKEVTQLSGYSYSMFSRLFSILTEITLSEYLRSRRLTEAAIILRDTDEKIIDVAFKFGYESSDSFGTAFKNFHGFTPSEVRNGKPFKLVSRDGFNQMITDAIDGKIDLIVTKSVSRFARNTVDSLQTVRKLKEKGIEIYFEKENIWTLDAKGELLITIMSSLAQEESRSISENITWGRRKQFAKGKGSVGFKHFLGYDKDFAINKEEAKTVKLIYKLYASGLSFYAVAKELTYRGIKTPFGKDKWHVSTVKSILTNEKYKGDALWQKGYISDFLQKTRKENRGEIPQYYVEEHHEAIIQPEQFDYIQAEIARRENDGRGSGLTIFSNKIKCGKCGAW